MARVYLGTSGYAYNDWHGPLYPLRLPPSKRLEYYLERFALVEINSTYYRPPTARMIAGISDRIVAVRGDPTGPEGGRLVIKAPASLTHDRAARVEELRTASDSFAAALRPALEVGVLAGVVLQFPWSFHYRPAERRYLAEVADALLAALGAPVLVELRNGEWHTESVAAGLRERRLVAVATDGPQLAGLPPAAWDDPLQRRGEQSTDRTLPGYLRLHGRNGETWWSGTNVTRYDYNYPAPELQQIARWILAELEAGLPTLYVALNNHARGQAVHNALALTQELREAGVDVM